MSLKGQTVRIIIHEPSDWSNGNLFGTILSDRGSKTLFIELSKPIRVNDLLSNLIELRPRIISETFKPLSQYYSVIVDGNLITENPGHPEYLISGSVTIG